MENFGEFEKREFDGLVVFFVGDEVMGWVRH
jgi:hypothetical protein